jgi:hypothetical protein
MNPSIVEFLRVVRFAIHNWQRTLCLATLLILLAVPAVAYVALRDSGATKGTCGPLAARPLRHG